MPEIRRTFSAASELRYSILAAQREGHRQLALSLAAQGVTPSQAEVIMVLSEYGPITLRGLGRLLVCESGSPSRLVDTLVKRGLVHRVDNPMDRRQVLLQLTPAGHNLCPEVLANEKTTEESLREAFGEELLEEFVQATRRFLSGSAAGEALRLRFVTE
ncbi:MAG TPA: MarR family transcriptional regulator [Candidatus Nesterenkonia stercoripullorum]|uniref:MarR family transcriptional regulator n=1 Tax=Candidatus Nesterenkonia stercoripullorum TaxID=2838701 RepID=A0A9D1UTH4_9MICC|nr:MarR family transcriptional regulator [Candidatus Nesterenkonia stercoripullorum]